MSKTAMNAVSLLVTDLILLAIVAALGAVSTVLALMMDDWPRLLFSTLGAVSWASVYYLSLRIYRCVGIIEKCFQSIEALSECLSSITLRPSGSQPIIEKQIDDAARDFDSVYSRATPERSFKQGAYFTLSAIGWYLRRSLSARRYHTS